MYARLQFGLVIVLLLFSIDANARDTRHRFPISDVVNNPEYSQRLRGVSFYFGDQPHPKIEKSYGEWKTNKKTNAFKKTDEFACQWAMLSALLSLHKRAIDLGGNAVIGIKSNYKNQVFESEEHYECGAGALMAGVAFKGVVVELPQSNQ